MLSYFIFFLSFYYCKGHLFTHFDNIQGNIGIGKLPYNLHNYADNIVEEYKNFILDMNMTTHHMWYSKLDNLIIKSYIDEIQYDLYWSNLCSNSNSNNCLIVNIPEMTELYYSNPNNKSKNLYGASANFDPHTDCFYNFNNIRFYRVLIGLTDGNKNTITYFPNFNIGHKLNKGEYIIFDFDRTTHQVIKDKNISESSYRILLKIHFLVFENDKFSKYYINSIKNMYLYYDYITRYILENGTDPVTYYQFFMGLLSQFFISPYTLYIILILSINIVTFLVFYLNIKQIKYIFLYLFMSLFKIYLTVVFFYWYRYQLYGIK